MNVDLHTHSSASDGNLSPAELLSAACLAGVEMLAITDHDTLAGYTQASTSSAACRLIPGIELSTVWAKTGIHVLGLNFRPDHPELVEGVRRQQAARAERAGQIAERLGKAGFKDSLEGATRIAGKAILGRPHFAQYLVESGQIKDAKTAFRKYLGQGKVGDVRNNWASLQDVIGWINAAGGIAVLAHPAKYKLTNLKLETLVRDFKESGGGGLEVICGLQDSSLSDRLARLANRFGLLASVGSDFHAAGKHWAALGQPAQLPKVSNPVWESWC